METYQCLGIQRCEFRQRDNSIFSGYKIFYGCVYEDVDGLYTGFFCCRQLPDWMKVGCEFNPIYDRHGKVVDLLPVNID